MGIVGVEQFPVGCAGATSLANRRIPVTSCLFSRNHPCRNMGGNNNLSRIPVTSRLFGRNHPCKHISWNTNVLFSVRRNSKLAMSTVKCSTEVVESSPEWSSNVEKKSVSVILLAGGKGKRMGANMPKQYLPIMGQPIALYSLYTFSRMAEVKEIIVVCDPSYNDIFEDTKETIQVDLKFTLPGKERQDSVYSGLKVVDSGSKLVCVHDSARPLVLHEDAKKVLNDAWVHGAAVLGVPAKATIKEANHERFVVRTLDRKTLWEMQTPQVIRPELLKKGFDIVNRENLEVTDDVSIVEYLKHPVYITEGSYTNIKVTTPDDLLLAERILSTSS